MSFRQRLAGSVAVWTAVALLLLPGCSSDPPRDIHGGTDADLDFVPPDSGTVNDASDDAAVEESGHSVDGSTVEVSSDESQVEAVSDLDAAIDGAN
jgi:hypothetical protein